MKKLVNLFLVLLIANTLPAQKDFEGCITYKVTQKLESDNGDTPEEINIWFGHGRIRVNTIKGGTEEYLLLAIDSGKAYSLNKTSKTYEVNTLKTRKKYAVAEKEVIAGHIATPVQSGTNLWGSSFGMSSILWFSDSLLFNVPEKFEGNEELLMVHNNHILLKARIVMDLNLRGSSFNDESEPSDSSDENYFVLEAIKVMPQPTAPGFFTIPDDYTKLTLLAMPDTAAIMVDTAMAEEIEPPPPPAPKKAPAKTPVKGKTYKSSLRKEN